MKTPLIIALSAIGGGIVGGAVTYITVNKALVRRYEDWANDEIAQVRAHYNNMLKEEGTSVISLAENPSEDVQKAVDLGKQLIKQLGYDAGERPEDDEHPTAQRLSIFDQGVSVNSDGELVEDDDAEGDSYLQAMDDGYKVIDGEPYLIAEAEYFENEPGYELDTLTYYEQDETLTDDKNKQIDGVNEVIGARHLHMFHPRKGTQKESLYVRNDDHETLYEIIRVDGSYAAIVLGMTDEELGLKPAKQKLKKMRDAD